jgi:hypothetical protein
MGGRRAPATLFRTDIRCSLVPLTTPRRGSVLRPSLLDVDQCACARAEEVVLQRRKRSQVVASRATIRHLIHSSTVMLSGMAFVSRRMS